MTVAGGEVWVGDTGGEVRRLVYVISDERFHQLAGRAVVAPIVDDADARWPWEIDIGGRMIASHQLRTIPTDRLLRRVEHLGLDTLRQARHAVRQIAGAA